MLRIVAVSLLTTANRDLSLNAVSLPRKLGHISYVRISVFSNEGKSAWIKIHIRNLQTDVLINEN